MGLIEVIAVASGLNFVLLLKIAFGSGRLVKTVEDHDVSIKDHEGRIRTLEGNPVKANAAHV